MSGSEGLFSQPCRFVVAAALTEQFPASVLPEIAFIGRSNAGKSSLINAVARQKNLARASKTPGRTQQIVFFNAADRLSIADLPGYGHAKAPKAAVTAWRRLIQNYLLSRACLRCVGLLVDSRHGLLANDLAMLEQLDRAAISTQVIMAKVDYLRVEQRNVRQKEIEEVLRRHPAARLNVMMASAKKDIGINALRDWLVSFTAN